MNSVTITQEDCIGGDYMSQDCPLARAIKRELPNFPLGGVGGSFIIARQEEGTTCILPFAKELWNSALMSKLAKGEIPPIIVEF